MLPKTASLVLGRLRSPLARDLPSAFGFPQSTPSAIHAPALRALLLQEPRSTETAAIGAAVAEARLPVDVHRVHTDSVGEHVAPLRAGVCLPVGTPDFVRACMRLAGITEPKWSQYPRELAVHMLQSPRRVSAAGALRALKPVFVKPAGAATFRGFVLAAEVESMAPAAREQLDRLLELPPSTSVWVARALEIQSEWRYYVLFGEVIGFARFSPEGPGIMPSPAVEDISAVIATIPNDAAYGLDVAVLDDGEISVTAVRDAWGLQLVTSGKDSPPGLDFLKLLWTRWSGLILDARREVSAANSRLHDKARDARA